MDLSIFPLSSQRLLAKPEHCWLWGKLLKSVHDWSPGNERHFEKLFQNINNLKGCINSLYLVKN